MTPFLHAKKSSTFVACVQGCVESGTRIDAPDRAKGNALASSSGWMHTLLDISSNLTSFELIIYFIQK